MQCTKTVSAVNNANMKSKQIISASVYRIERLFMYIVIYLLYIIIIYLFIYYILLFLFLLLLLISLNISYKIVSHTFNIFV
jgi:hypothetical protein